MEVPSLEEQQSDNEFKHERTMLVLLCQSKYDACVKEKGEIDIKNLFSKESGEYNKLLVDFETKTKDERLTIIE